MTTLTIPGTVAYHVVGETSVELAQGDLTVIASSSNSHAIPKSPVLVLTVAQAAFQIYEDTIFGTVEGDDRVYVFKPSLGEGVSGYVITLSFYAISTQCPYFQICETCSA